MPVVELVTDLNSLRGLAQGEPDPPRRAELIALRHRLAHRDKGAKVSEAAEVLGVSTPTLRSWIEAGLLVKVPKSSPVRVDVMSLADVKHIVDLLRAHGHDRDLLSAISRRLHDQDLLGAADVAAGRDDLRNGRLVPIGDDLRREVAALDRERLDLDEEVIADICRRRHVRRLSLFGSAASATFDPSTSDADFLVEFQDGADDLFGTYFDLKDELEGLLGRSVDLVMPKALENPYFAESVERTRRDLYAA